MNYAAAVAQRVLCAFLNLHVEIGFGRLGIMGLGRIHHRPIPLARVNQPFLKGAVLALPLIEDDSLA